MWYITVAGKYRWNVGHESASPEIWKGKLVIPISVSAKSLAYSLERCAMKNALNVSFQWYKRFRTFRNGITHL